jgi:steroid delta-isomerase-like uncharacterized protein
MSDWIQRYLDAWDSHDPAKVGAFMASNATYEDLAVGEIHEGRDAIEEFVGTSDKFSRDYKFTLVSEQTSGNDYAVEWEMAGTNTGEAAGLPATNKPYRIRGVSIGRLNDAGKIVQNRDYWNMADYLTQVGIFPPAR